MSIELPGALTHALSLIGMDWPAADEDALFAAAGAWSDFGAALREVDQTTGTVAARIWDTNTGPAVEAFRSWWEDQPHRHLSDDADGADLVSTLLDAFGGATVALKTVYLVQLGILAATIVQAVATAFVTFGASLAEIPIVTTAVRLAVKAALDELLQKILF